MGSCQEEQHTGVTAYDQVALGSSKKVEQHMQALLGSCQEEEHLCVTAYDQVALGFSKTKEYIMLH